MRITDVKDPRLNEGCEPEGLFPVGFELPPSRFVEPNSEGRLISTLRTNANMASVGNILPALEQACLAHVLGDPLLALALCDLVVTGRSAYATFVSENPSDAALTEFVLSNHAADEAAVREAVEIILNRAYRVAWNLIHPLTSRASGWFALAGDIDPAHRPLNGPPQTYNQHDITVSVQFFGAAAGMDVTTRFIVWDEANAGEAIDIEDYVRDRVLPSSSTPIFDASKRYLLYVHGLGSSADEPARLAEALLGSGLTVVSMDLPNSGCAKLIDHLDVAPTNNYMSLEDFPLLDFIEQFVIDFVGAVAGTTGFPLHKHVAAVMGGSLGGNITLRLAGRDHDRVPWLTTFIPWSAASVWNPAISWPRNEAYKRPWGDMLSDETPDSRVGSIQGTYDKHVLPGILTFTIASTWYCNCYAPCKQLMIQGGREAAKQGYHELRRKWSSRLAAEQMLFSHASPRERLDALTGRMLLLAGDDDNYTGVNIFDASRQLATSAIATKGALALLRLTGHSMHDERPRELAAMILGFVPGPPPEPTAAEIWTGWESLGGEATSPPAIGVNADGALEIFVRNERQTLSRLRQSGPNGSWDPLWFDLVGGFDSSTTFGRQIAVERHMSGALELFCDLTSHGWIAHVSQDRPNGAWGSWATGTHLAQLIGAATDSAFVVSRFAPGVRIGDGDMLAGYDHTRLILVGARTTDGRIHVRGRTRLGGWWTYGKNVADQGATFQGTPFVLNAMSAKTLIFARRTNGYLGCAVLDGDDDWDTDWIDVGGAATGSDATAEIDSRGNVHVVARSSGGDLMLSRNTGDTNSWSAWEIQDADIAGDTKPIIVRNPWGELQVFATWRDGSVRSKRQRLGITRTWTEWMDLGGVTKETPAVAANANGMLTVVIAAPDGIVHANCMQFARRRVFSSAIRVGGRVTHLVTDDGEQVPVESIIADILASGAAYFIRFEDGTQNHLIVRQYLTTRADEDEDNNLSSLPVIQAGTVAIVAPPTTPRERQVSHLIVNGELRRFGTKRLYNQTAGWSVDELVAFEQILAGTYHYFIDGDNEIIARQFLSTSPDDRTDNNLGALPSYQG